jgi:hypothetical protein
MATLGNFTSGSVLSAAELNAIGTWQDFTPNWSGLTEGNAPTTIYKYCQINEIVFVKAYIEFGSTTAITGSVTFEPPVASDNYFSEFSQGNVLCEDSNGTDYWGTLFRLNSTTSTVRVYNSSGTYLASTDLSSTVPFTWATGDKLSIEMWYRTT